MRMPTCRTAQGSAKLRSSGPTQPNHKLWSDSSSGVGNHVESDALCTQHCDWQLSRRCKSAGAGQVGSAETAPHQCRARKDDGGAGGGGRTVCTDENTGRVGLGMIRSVHFGPAHERAHTHRSPTTRTVCALQRLVTAGAAASGVAVAASGTVPVASASALPIRTLGLRVGDTVGEAVGRVLGGCVHAPAARLAVGTLAGRVVGLLVGSFVGDADGNRAPVGSTVG